MAENRIDQIRRLHADGMTPCRGVIDELLAHIERLWAACELFTEMVYVPESNCSCHITPPCHDCVENGGLREVDVEIRAALALAEKEAGK